MDGVKARISGKNLATFFVAATRRQSCVAASIHLSRRQQVFLSTGLRIHFLIAG
jgi:hypothetical protein